MQNVVTYIVVVGTTNPSMQLVPGMTANVRIVTDQRDGVLKVPNAALRWRPAGVASAKDEPAPVAQGPGPGGGDPQARRQRLIDELKLDAGQVARLDEIFAEQRSRFMEIREMPEAERRPRMERSRADARQRINAMLNAEQQKRYAEIVATETGRAGAVGGSGRVFVLAGRSAAGGPHPHRAHRRQHHRGRLRRARRGPGGDRGHAAARAEAPPRPAGNAPRLPF